RRARRAATRQRSTGRSRRRARRPRSRSSVPRSRSRTGTPMATSSTSYDTTTKEAPMYLTIRSDRTDERVRALLEAGAYLDDDALDALERAGEYVYGDPEVYFVLAGVDGWYLDEDGHSHYIP